MALRSLLDLLPGARRSIIMQEPQPDISSGAPRERFFGWAPTLDATGSVLEVGTKQAVEGESTHSQDEFTQVRRENYLMIDVEDGSDVDLVADLHKLPTDWTGRFDAFIAVAVFEHLERPWIAAKEVARILKPGGRCYIATHQTFPLHGYPSDFFRFSREALSLIFEDAGIRTLEVAYEHRTQIIAPTTIMPARYAKDWNAVWPSYLIVHLAGEKPL